MVTLVAIAFAGFIAQLVDGSLGMGYGVTSTTLLLSLGLTPALASASVHLAEIGTSGVSGVSHWRLGNVNARVLLLVGVPGGIGAFFGAVVLSNLALEAARPMVSLILLILGGVIVLRFLHGRRVAAQAAEAARLAEQGIETPAGEPRRGRRWMLIPLGLVGGFLDASGGGGWGPVTTSSLMAASRMRPRTIIGTVSGAEFIVALAASAGFVVGLGSAGIQPGVVAMLLLGGMLAAPIAAWLVSRFDDRSLGTAVGGVIILLNLDRGLALLGIEPAVTGAVRAAALVLAVAVLGWLVARGRARRAAAGIAA